MFNHEMLEKRINEMFGCMESFGEKLGLSKQRINSRLKGATEFSLSEIDRCAELLRIPPEHIPAYFFDVR